MKATYYDDDDKHGHGCHDRNGSPRLRLELRNDAARSVTFTVTFNNYAPHAKPQKLRVAAHSCEQWELDACKDADGSYDITVTLSNHASWSQRLTGHLETGRQRHRLSRSHRPSRSRAGSVARAAG